MIHSHKIILSREKNFRVRVEVQWVCLPSTYRALASIPNTTVREVSRERNLKAEVSE